MSCEKPASDRVSWQALALVEPPIATHAHAAASTLMSRVSSARSGGLSGGIAREFTVEPALRVIDLGVSILGTHNALPVLLGGMRFTVRRPPQGGVVGRRRPEEHRRAGSGFATAATALLLDSTLTGGRNGFSSKIAPPLRKHVQPSGFYPDFTLPFADTQTRFRPVNGRLGQVFLLVDRVRFYCV